MCERVWGYQVLAMQMQINVTFGGGGGMHPTSHNMHVDPLDLHGRILIDPLFFC